MRTRLVDITPDRSLLPKLGFAGYSAPQAIAELVDNAIDSRREGKKLHIHIRITPNLYEVTDDALGMDYRTISKALVLAWSRKKGSLGEFGLGLKTACLSLGTAFEVHSSTGGGREYRVAYDPVKWMKSGRAWRIPLQEVRAKRGKPGTKVLIRHLKVYYPRLPSVIRQDLQRRFAPFVRSRDVDVVVNGRACHVEEIQLLPRSRKEFSIRTRGGERIRGWYGLLAEGSTKGYYGFHTYRRNRMITTFDKIAIGEDPTLSRIIGEIHMDHLLVTHNKREFIRENRAYREAVTLLKREFRTLLRSALRQSRLDTVTTTVQREVRSWQRRIADAVNSEDFRRFAARMKLLAGSMGGGGKSVSTSGGSSKKTGRSRRPGSSIQIRGKTIPLRHHYAPLGVRAGRKQSTVTRQHGMEIYTNTDFPAYPMTRDKVFYAVLNVAETIAEFLIRESHEDPAHTEEIKDLILRKASELKLEMAK